jgi:hypothetical protein
MFFNVIQLLIRYTKARFTRWSEELRLVGYEMKWTVN